MPSTANFGWVLPVDGSDDDAWGGELNTTTFASIDTSVWAIKGTADTAMPKAGGVFTGRVDALSGRVKMVALGSVSGAQNLDLSLGNYFTLTSGGNLTLTPTGMTVDSTYAQFIFIRFTNPGAHTVAFAGGTFKLPVAGTPTWSATSDDFIAFVTEDGGTTWRMCGLKQAITT
jgi:hypothetical protein